MKNILLGINGIVLTEYYSIGSSDEETDEIMSQPAKKTKGIGGSVMNYAITKPAPSMTKKNAIKYYYDEESDVNVNGIVL